VRILRNRIWIVWCFVGKEFLEDMGGEKNIGLYGVVGRDFLKDMGGEDSEEYDMDCMVFCWERVF
jgi:hypothetical protein